MAIEEMQRQMQAGFARIDCRLRNIEARPKSEDAFERRADYVLLVKADGTAIPNFPLNSEAVEGLNTLAINALLTDLGVDFQGRNLPMRRVLFLREIDVKTTHNV
ncbi:hypothetical protein FCOIX_3132 [Fusarium coicis]|nr:hypothetical protein FCOIX_3132 [Fusarium coicis]